jgi:hypothetical protein
MSGVLEYQLFHHQEQEKTEGEAGNEKALPEMQKAYYA